MKIVIAGGGTGGHLFPGIAIAREFIRTNNGTSVLFIGTRNGIESRVIPEEGFNIRYIKASGMHSKSLYEKAISLAKLPISIFQSLSYLIGFKPDLVVGIGGYASGAVGISSYILKIPLVIQEQNLEPGATNKILGRFADMVFTSFKETASFFEKTATQYTGNPIRQEIVDISRKNKENNSGIFTVLVFGGSQGAASINKAVLAALPHLEEEKNKIELIHQTGGENFEEVQEKAKRSGLNITVVSFIRDMAQAYQKADLVVSRAGATSLAEITASGKPAILIPFPFATKNHQEKNARNLEKKGGAKVILESQLTGELLAREIITFCQRKELLQEMGDASRQAGAPYAAREIVQKCLDFKERANV